MRVINQDGVIDIPYERYCFSLKYTDKTVVIAWDMLSSGDELVEMGKYSSEEKAMKALEMLRNHFIRMQIIFQFPKDEEIEV